MSLSVEEDFPRNFFDKDVEAVAKALIGTSLFTVNHDGIRTGGRIVETEAYDEDDCAAHCFCPDGKKPSKLGAAEAMFLSGGHAYVFWARKVWCVNFVTGTERKGSAVLIRALVPEIGADEMRKRHSKRRHEPRWNKDDEKYIYSLCKGPGNLCISLGIDGSLNKRSLFNLPFEFRIGDGRAQIVSGRRVRVKGTIEKSWPNIEPFLKKEAIDRSWRFADGAARDFVSEKTYPLN